PPPPEAAPEPPKAPAVAAAMSGDSQEGRPAWLHIRVSDLATGKNKVTVNVPLRLVKFGMRLGQRFTPEAAGLDWNELSTLATEKGVLVDVQDEEDGEQVQIYVD
ncbi:MAG: hypothetical protein L0322_28530, partial [Chloroflexi bacterium]|nr:hypothetical protein [Chloroflexota bacterium]